MTPAPRRGQQPPLLVDRIACTGQGVCAQVIPEYFSLDAHGYPIVRDDQVPRQAGDTAIKMCPAAALYWQGS